MLDSILKDEQLVKAVQEEIAARGRELYFWYVWLPNKLFKEQIS